MKRPRVSRTKRTTGEGDKKRKREKERDKTRKNKKQKKRRRRRRRRRTGVVGTKTRVYSLRTLLFGYNWKDRIENKRQGQFMAAMPSGVGD